MQMTLVFSTIMRMFKKLKFLNKEFSPLYQWFMDNKLSIHLGEDKVKSILFSKVRGFGIVNVSFVDHSIKQHETMEHHGCQLYFKLSGEALASKVPQKINAKLKFLYQQSRNVTPAYNRLLCNALIQSNFDYGCSSGFPLSNKNLKVKLQKSQNKCIRFYLNLPLRSHTDLSSHFKKIN